MPILQRAALAGLPAVLFLAWPAHADNVSFYSGVDYTSGDYGLDEDTSMLRVPVSVSADFGAVSVFAETAWVSVDGPAGAAANRQYGQLAAYAPRLADWLARRETDEDDDTSSGLGDSLFGATARLTPADALSWVGFTAAVSAPTGDEEEGLGTGTTDITLALDGETPIGLFDLYAGFGYAILEDADLYEEDEAVEAFASVRDVAFANLGARYHFESGPSVGMTLNWSQSAYEDNDDIVSVSMNGNVRLSDSVSLSVRAFRGLAGEGADSGASLGFAYTPSWS